MNRNKRMIEFKNEKLFLEVGQYRNNGALSIFAFTEDDTYGDITINLPGFFTEENEGFINAITKDSGLEEKLIKEGIIKKVITTVKYNMGKYDLVLFNMDKLKEYDFNGVEEYRKNLAEEFE